ncbi:cytochrome c biogenesis CcdA family protein [Leptospirillum ferrooxidans]|jgi:cytochrome c-type biogenesis protein|uniref:Cytochrome c biogenesis protein n=1 Tax=Leptospirillum ferrooxidans (strain C2-3) TaxID=1162668 RepID=I0IRB4_LEPFC|nr:cytochrome c biogenesis protein CcdA [Leptospirillum ferrooxidans]BAM07813.1 cytochrome c biogenesis protein [Leptospirillum ferrooxidans C2-3]
MNHEPLSVTLAFLAGMVSFVSPCVLPIVPSYISFITGLSFDQLTGKNGTVEKAEVTKTTVVNSLAFIFGFSALFIGFGASASFIGEFLLTYQEAIRRVGGLIIVIFGLFIAGILKVPFLNKEFRLPARKRTSTLAGTFLIGVGFAAGWTPCVGPILGSILFFAGSEGNVLKGIELLAFYSLGLAVPFFLSAVMFNSFLGRFSQISRWIPTITKVSGGVLVVMGVLVFANAFSILSSFLTQHHIGWTSNL